MAYTPGAARLPSPSDVMLAFQSGCPELAQRWLGWRLGELDVAYGAGGQMLVGMDVEPIDERR
jgi:hypothetical protein